MPFHANDRFMLAGVDLRQEMRRYSTLPVFGRTFKARGLPKLTVRRSRYGTNRRGFAEPWRWRIHLSIYDDAPLWTVRRTLVHELCHLYVGKVGKEWHGVRFQVALKRALAEAGLSYEQRAAAESA